MASVRMSREVTPRPATVQQQQQVSRRRWRRQRPLIFYLFIAPWLLGFVFLTVFPLFYGLVVSFTNFDGISGNWKFVGWRNYVELFHDPLTWNGLWHTLIFSVLVVPFGLLGGLGLAILVNQRLRAKGLLRTLFYLPSIVPAIAAAFMWKYLFDSGNGPIDAIITALHGPNIVWTSNTTALWTLAAVVLWAGIGGNMLISLAGLQGVPQELLEAAKIDGATPWKTFRNVTLPILSPVLFFELVTGIIAVNQIIVQPLFLASSAGAYGYNVPASIQLYMVNVYEQFFVQQRFGYGSALLWVMFVLILIITLLLFRFARFWVYYEVDNE